MNNFLTIFLKKLLYGKLFCFQVTVCFLVCPLCSYLAQAYQKDYGKQVEGSVEVQSLTGSPYTVISKVGVVMMTSQPFGVGGMGWYGKGEAGESTKVWMPVTSIFCLFVRLFFSLVKELPCLFSLALP